MKALILAGGRGTRLREVAGDRPKPMMPINGKPFIEYLIARLKKYCISDIVIAVGYQSHLIIDYFGDGREFGVNIVYSTEEQPLGTGGALRNARKLLGSSRFFVLNGDSYFSYNFHQAIDEHKKANALATLALISVSDVSRYGAVKISENREIVAFDEKSQQGSGLINGGIYLFENEIFEYIGEGQVSLENDVIKKMIGNRLNGFVVNSFFIDIGLPNDYWELANNPTLIK